MHKLCALVALFGALLACQPVPTSSTGPGTTPATIAPPPARVYGVLIADPSHLDADKAAGITLAIRSEHWNDWSPAKATAERAVLDRYRAAGFRVGINFGLHAPPANVVADPDGALVDQNGKRSPQANLTWSASVRAQAAIYMADVLAKLGPLDVVTVGVGSTGEATYPNPINNGWWAYGPSAQASSPLPGWVPGQPATPEQRGAWWTWYRDSLTSTMRWAADTIRAAGHQGVVQIQMPGKGASPAVFATAQANGFAGATGAVRSAAVFDQTIPVLASIPGAVITTTSVGSHTGTPIANPCQPGDGALEPTDPTIDTWSASRWVTYLGLRAGASVWAENVGWNEPADMPMITAQIDGCAFPVFDWAFDYQLFDGTNAGVADLAALITANP